MFVINSAPKHTLRMWLQKKVFYREMDGTNSLFFLQILIVKKNKEKSFPMAERVFRLLGMT